MSRGGLSFRLSCRSHLCYARRMRQRVIGAAFFLLAASLWESTAHAYILPTDFLMRMVADRRRRMGLRDLTIQLQTEINNGESEVEERIYFKQSERMRIVREASPSSIYVDKEGVRAEGTPKLSRLSGATSNLLPLLFVPRGDDLEQAATHMVAGLRAVGIDVATVSLARNGEDIAYVIGAQPWETDKPQLWIDKERFLPVRCILQVPAGAKASKLETRMLEYGSSVAGDWFPRVLETYRDGALLARAEVVSVQTNESLPESLFDVP